MTSKRNLRHILILAAAIAAMLILPAGVATAATLTWDANGLGDGQPDGGGAWLDANQWWDGANNPTWTSGDDAIFGAGGAGGAVTLAIPTAVNSLTFNGFTGTYTLGTAGQAITLTAGLTMNAGAGNVAIVSPVTLGGSQNWTNSSASTFTVSGATTGGANILTLDGTGAGLTTLTGGLSFSGAGGLVIGKSGALGTTISGGAITLGGTGGIVINGGASAVSLGAATISAAQSWANNSTTAMTTAGILAINSQLSLTAGTIQFGNFANTGTGGVVINGATAQAGNAAAFGTGTLTLTSGTVSSDGGTARILTNAVSINGSVTLGDATNSGALTFSGATQAITGSNTIALAGGNVSFTTGAMSLAAGSNTTFSSAGPTLTMSGGFNTNGGTDTLTLNTAANAVTLSGAFTGTAGTLILAGSGTNVTVGALTATANAVQVNSTTGGVYTFSGASTYTGGTRLTSGKLNINLAGTAGASGPLGNGGVFTINGGTIDNTSGAAKVLLNVNPITLGGDFAFSTSAGTALNNLSLPGAITMAADRTVTLNGLGALTLSGLLTNTADSVRTLTVNNGTGTGATSLLTIGSYNLTGAGSTGARTDIINGTGNVTISGVVGNGVSAGSGLTYGGSGILTLSGANTYTGTTAASGGVLRLNNATALPGGIGATGGTSALTINGGVVELANGNFLRNLGTGAAQFQITGGTSGFSAYGAARVVTVNNDAALELVWGSATFAPGTLVLNEATANNTLTLSNKINLGAASRTIAVNANTATLSGLISGSGGLTKTGAGTLTLSAPTVNNYNQGSANQFTGVTKVTAGKIVLPAAGGGGGVVGWALALWKSPYDTTGSGGGVGLDVTGCNTLVLGGLAGSVDLSTAVTAGWSTIGKLVLNPQQGTAVSYGGVIGNGTGNMPLFKIGPGTQTLTNASTYTGATTVGAGTLVLSDANGSVLNSAVTVKGGTLSLDNSAAWANRLADGTAVSLGSLTLTSKDGTGAQSEAVGATTFATSGKVTINNGATVGDKTTLALGAVARSAGAAINFVGTGGTLGGDANSPNVTSTGAFPGTSNGILPWATVGGTQWAENNVNSIRAYSGAFVDPTSADSNATLNAQLTGAGIIASAKSFNSLNVVSNGAGQGMDLSGGNLTLTSGAILKSGADAYTISSTSGNITAGTELIAHVDGGDLTISAPLNTAIVGIAKGGDGKLILSGTRNATFSGATSIAGTLEFQGNSITLSGAVSGPGGLTVNLNPGQALELYNNANSYTGPTVVKGGTLKLAYNQDGLPGGAHTWFNYANTSLAGSNLELANGVLWVGYGFGRSLGAGPDQFQITGGTSGFSINTGANGGFSLDYGRELVWGSTYFKPDAFVLNDSYALANLTVPNALDLNGATRTVAANSAGFAGILSGVIRDSSGGSAGIIKTGPGELQLTNAANTYSGVVTVNQGTLTVSTLANGGSNSGLGKSGSAASNLLLANGTTLKYTGGAISTDRSFTINGTAAGDSASLNASGSAAVNFTSPACPAYGDANQTRTLTLTGTSTFANTLAANLADNGTGAVSLAKTGTGTWVLTGTNVYTGTTNVSAGTLTAPKAATLPGYNTSGKVTVAGGATIAVQTGDGTAGWDANQIDSLRGNATWSAATSILAFDTTAASFAYASNITQALTVAKLGANTLSLSGANTYTGGTNLSAGTVSFTGTGLGSSGAITFTGNSTLQWGADANTDLSPRLVINNGITATIDTNGNGVAFATGIGAGGTGALTKDGTGALTLSAPNTYTGLTKVTTGTLTLGHNRAIQYSSLDTTGAAGFVAFSSGVTTPTIGGLAGAVNLATKFTTGYSAVTELTLNPLSGTQTYTGVVSDGNANMALTMIGTGTQILQGVNTYTGATNVNAGTLTVSGASGTIKNSAAINLNGGNLTLSYADSDAEKALDRVSNTAAVTSNGGTITYTTTTAASTRVFAETLGSVALTSGQLNIVETLAKTAGSQTLTLSGLAQAGSSAVTVSSPAFNAFNMIKVTGAGATPVGQIIGPWATVGTTAALQTDYAVYDASANIVPANITATTEGSWTGGAGANYTSTSTTNTLTGARTMNSWRYNAAAGALTLGASNFDANGILNGGSGLLTISGTGALRQRGTAAANLYITAGNNAITINAPIKDNTGALTLVKGGSSIVILDSAGNSFTGGIVVNAGTLQIAANTANTLGSGGTYTGNIFIAPGASMAFWNSGTQTLNGVISGGGNLVKAYGTLVLNGNNTYTGRTLIQPQTNGGGGTISVSSFNSVFTDPVLGTVHSASSSLGAPTTVANGTIDVGNASVQSSCTLTYTGLGETTDRVINLACNANATRTLNASGSGPLKFTSQMTKTGANTNNLTLGGTGSGEIVGGLPAMQNFTKADAGTWTLNGTSLYTGSTTITGGVLLLNNANAIPGGIGATGGTSALTFNSASGVIGVIGLGAGDFTRPLAASGVVDGVYFSNRGGWAAFGADRVVNIGGDSRPIAWATQNGGFNGQIVLLSASTATRTVDLQNPIDLTGATRTIHVYNGAAAVDAILSGVISGSAALSRTGAGTLYLSNTANTYTGATTLDSDSTVCVSKLADGDANSSIGKSGNDSGNLSLKTRATLRYLGTTVDSTNRGFTINGAAAGDYATLDASGAGAVSFTNTASPAYGTNHQTRTLILTGANTGNNTLAAGIANNGTGAVSVTKDGAGKWVLTGSSTYTGNTTVNAGTLSLADDAQLKFAIGASQTSNKITGTGAVSLAGDFYFDLGGASTTLNDWWRIVDVGLTKAYEGSFLVTSTLGDFAPDSGGDKWTKLIPSTLNAYEFTESDGILKVVLGILPGDTNGDFVVDAADYLAVKQNLGLTTGATLGQGNLDGDGDVDWDDLQLVMTNFGAGAGTTPATTPEPCSAMLLVLGAMAVLRRNRRS